MDIMGITSKECSNLLKRYELQTGVLNKSAITNFTEAFNELRQAYKLELIAHNLEIIPHGKHTNFLDYHIAAMCDSCVFRSAYYKPIDCKASPKKCRKFRKKLDKLCALHDENMYYVWFAPKE